MEWWRGPQWLKLQENWPNLNYNYEIPNEISHCEIVKITISQAQTNEPFFQHQVPSSWTRLKQMIVYVTRFVKIYIWMNLSQETKQKHATLFSVMEGYRSTSYRIFSLRDWTILVPS